MGNTCCHRPEGDENDAPHHAEDPEKREHEHEPEHNDTLVRLRLQSSWNDIRTFALWRAVLAESMGTGMLVFLGCASCVPPGPNQVLTIPPTSTVRIALTFGFAVATIVWSIGHISGGHINPAVTIAMLCTRNISLVRAVLYVLVQIIGAIIGAAILKSTLFSEIVGTLGMTSPTSQMTVGDTFGVEYLITAVLVFTVFATVDTGRLDLHGSRALAIGLAVVVGNLAFVPLTGASLNPARSLGPAAVLGNSNNGWLYWLAPIFGGISAAWLYEFIFATNSSLEKFRGFICKPDYSSSHYPPHSKDHNHQPHQLGVAAEEAPEGGTPNNGYDGDRARTGGRGADGGYTGEGQVPGPHDATRM